MSTRKMISGSVIAVLLGVIMALPLIYTSTVIAPEPRASNLFDVSIAYAFIEHKNETVIELDSTTQVRHAITSTIGLNFTRYSEQVDLCDEKIEVYLIEVYSDKGHIENTLKYEGIAFNKSALGHANDVFSDFPSNPFFDRLIGGGGGSTTYWPVGESRVCFSGGESASTGEPSWTDSLRYADVVYLRVSRLGWSILTGNYSEFVVLPEPEVVAEVQLNKYKNGFLYNNLITEEELLQLDNPMYPYGNVLDSNP
jgi:hypothetical protein